MKRFNLALISASLVVLLQVGFLSAHAADIAWRSDIAAAAAEAKSSNRFMFVEISAPWCPACRRLEKLMGSNKIGEWTNPRFVSVHLSADAPGGKALLQKFGMHGIPALLVFDPNGKFKDKMSGAPSDVEGFKHFLTKMAGGEAALANVGNAGSGNFTPQTEPWTGGGTAGGAYPTPQDSYPQANYDQSPPQQSFQSPPAQNYLPPSQQAYQQPAQQAFQSAPAQNYLPPAQYQQFSQPVMQWQGQQPPNPQYQPPPPQYQQSPQQFQQPPQQFQQPPQQFQQPPQQFQQPSQQFQQPPQQFQQPPQQFQQPPLQSGQFQQGGQIPQTGMQQPGQFQQAPQQYPQPLQQYPQQVQPGQQYPQPVQQSQPPVQQYQTQYAPPNQPVQQQQR